MALSAADEAILCAIFQPSATRDFVAESHSLSLPALALWLAQPHIQQAYRSMLALEDHFRRQWAEHHYRTAIETLTEVQATSVTLPERHRAATSALAALRSIANGARGASQGQRARRASEGHLPGPAPSVPLRNAEGVARVFEGRGRCRSDVFDIEPGASRTEHPAPSTEHSPSPTQSSVLSPQHFPPEHSAPSTEHPSSPDATGDLLISRVQEAGPSATLHTVLDIADGPTLETYVGGLAFKAAFEKLAAALDGAVVTSTPAQREPDNLHALKRYALTNPAGQGHTDFAIRLYSPNGTTWWLEEIIPIDSS